MRDRPDQEGSLSLGQSQEQQPAEGYAKPQLFSVGKSVDLIRGGCGHYSDRRGYAWHFA